MPIRSRTPSEIVIPQSETNLMMRILRNQTSRTSLGLLFLGACGLFTGGPSPLRAAEVYPQRVVPFLKTYCLKCHNREETRGELDLTRFAKDSDVTGNFRRWNRIVEFIRDGKMPPEDEARQPSLKEREQTVSAVQDILLTEAKKHAGDPGVILPRRLSNTEYDLSIRDLTGVDLRPTAKFPADPAAGEGFDNTGEALSMSPSLLKKYLLAGQHVSEHLVLKPKGIVFAPFPVTSYAERKKFTEQAIIDFYEAREIRILDYLEAAWRYRHRGQSDRDLTLEQWAKQQDLSGKYLALVSKLLEEAPSQAGLLKQLGTLWNTIPAPKNDEEIPKELLALDRFIEAGRRKFFPPEESLIRSNAGNWPISHLDFRAKTAAMRDQFDPRVFQSRRRIRFDRLRAPKKKDDGNLTLYLRIESSDPKSGDNYVLLHRPLFSKSDNLPRNEREEQQHEIITLRSVLEQHAPDLAKRLAFGKHPHGSPLDADSFVLKAPAELEIPLSPKLLNALNGKHFLVDCELDPKHSPEGSVMIASSTGKRPDESDAANGEWLIHPESQTAKELAASAKRFCETFPNRFFYVDQNRGLAAGFHLVEGFFRDDQPLVQKVLTPQETQELDRLWEEMNFVTESSETLIRGFVWFERSERHVLHDQRFDFLRPEDPNLVQRELLDRFEKVYLGKMGIKLAENSLEPESPSERYDMIHGFFEEIRAGLAHHHELMKTAEGRALKDLNLLAERAYRRPLWKEETQSLRALYQALRKQGQDVEASLRGVLTAILMSPHFCYRYFEAPHEAGVTDLSDRALAGRLGYFLWSSLPDEQLLKAASEGQLHEGDQLITETRRMLKDPKIAAFAQEFFGQWLRYRDYLSKDPINAQTFPGYDESLRQAMFEEPTRLATYLVQQDRPVTDLLNTDTTFVNGPLAKHYGAEIAKQYQTKLERRKAEHKRKGRPPIETSDQVWLPVDGLRKAGRGGLFGMGVILTKNSAGERTSPVKRGFWTVHHLLGQHFPPPPANVPELPANEKTAPKTIRELLAEHASNPRCAMCHTHFDGLGLAMEGFDPIGRSRTEDLAGRAIDNAAKLPNGKMSEGIPGLIDYIEQHRRRDFVRTLCRKFLGYALGRSVLLSDQPLLDEMETALEQNGYRFSVLFETVVKSPQFRKQRGSEFVKTGRIK